MSCEKCANYRELAVPMNKKPPPTVMPKEPQSLYREPLYTFKEEVILALKFILIFGLAIGTIAMVLSVGSGCNHNSLSPRVRKTRTIQSAGRQWVIHYQNITNIMPNSIVCTDEMLRFDSDFRYCGGLHSDGTSVRLACHETQGCIVDPR